MQKRIALITPQEDIFLLSLFHKKLIGFDEVFSSYPLSEWHPRKKECTEYAAIVLDQVQQYDEVPFVEIHAGKTLADPIKVALEQHNIRSVCPLGEL